jgi:NADH-quinone oxidoreductase subunit G
MVGALDLGFIYGNSGNGTDQILKKTQNGEIKILYLLGADDIDMSQIGDDTFVIYQGHHGDEGANRADVILPEAAYTEQDGIYVNMEGRPQFARAAVTPPGSAKTGVEIVNIVAEALELDIKIDELSLIRKRMAQEYNIFNHIDEIVDNDFRSFESSVKLTKQPLEKIVMNYYMTDPISRASITMAKCTKAINEMQITGAFKERIEGVA